MKNATPSRRFAIAALAILTIALSVPSGASTQQLTASSPGAFPVGITVVASGVFTASDLVRIYTVAPGKGGTAASLTRSLKSAGLESSALQINPFSSVVRAAPERDRVVRSAIAHAHWQVQGDATSAPADPEAASQAALAAAVRVARKRAEAIAQADGRKVGRLLNVEPSAIDLLEGVADKINPLAALNMQSGPEVKAFGIFTFELLP
ncbi:MAG: hypothetical protein M3Y21_05620 [Candidatus Eremiobacteraeota bacterium]|nr:hypothetical protein [Candidatus Eremiobacteraeota bacterium]